MQTSTPKIINTARIEPRQYVAGIAANDDSYLPPASALRAAA